MNPSDVVVKKKRGRKPKVLEISDPSTETAADAQAPVKPKRGRKPKVVYSSIDTQNPDPQVGCLSDDDNVILQLSIGKLPEFECDMTNLQDNYHDIHEQGHPTIPTAYNVDNQPYFSSFTSHPCNIFPEELSSLDKGHGMNTLNEGSSSHDALKQTNKVVELLKDFEEKNKNNEWPTSTSIHCYWCCHKFDNSPFGIPIKYSDNRFHVYGCFCSLECALAFNNQSHDSVDEIWERRHLINMLAQQINYANYIKAAPSRLVLKMFGGYMTIDEFREFCKTSKLINVNFPPMMTLTQQVEEINECDIFNEFKYIPLDSERVNRYKERQMNLKRSKPINNIKNTLDHTMNIKIV